jgi:hypothetical protein
VSEELEMYEIYDRLQRKRAVELLFFDANTALNYLQRYFKKPSEYRVQGVRVAYASE